MVNTEVDPICQPCQPFNVKLDNSHLGGSKRVGAKFNNPGLSFDNATHPRLLQVSSLLVEEYLNVYKTDNE